MATVYAGPTPEDLLHIPEALIDAPHWILWRGKERASVHGGLVTLDKEPTNPQTLHRASSTDPATWAPFPYCVAALPVALEEWAHDPATWRGGGLGYVFDDTDLFCGVDLDHCIEAATGRILPWAQDIIVRLGSYTEYSPSGTGLHTLLRGVLPPGGRKRGPIEMYDTGRFFTVTGHHLPGTPATIEDRQGAIDALWCATFGARIGEYVWCEHENGDIANPTPWAITHVEYLPDQTPYAFFTEMPGGHPLIRCVKTVPTSHNGVPAPASPLMEDHVVLGRLFQAANGPKALRLWSGDMTGYPSQSEADQALCSLLVFWTQDAAQIDRLFRRSALMRPKWDELHGALSYGAGTIMKALAGVLTHYTAPPELIVAPASNGTAPVGPPTWSAPPRSPLGLTDLSDMFERTYPIPQWLIGGLIPEGLTFFVGSPKSSKTYLAYSLALSLAYESQRGVPWLGHYPVLTDGPVVYITLEDDEADSRLRIAELAPWMQSIPRDRFLFAHGWELPQLNNGLIDVLKTDVLERYHPAMVVLDPISYLYSPLKKNADQFTEVREMLLPLRWLGKTYHCAILGVDHRRKKNADDVDIFETTYGSNAKLAIADSIMMIVRDDKEITIHARVRKAADQTLTLGFTFESDGTAHWEWKGAIDGLVGQGQYGDLRQRVLNTLSSSPLPLTPKDVLAILDIPDSKQTRNALYQILVRAERSHEVQKTTKGHYVWAGGN